MKAIILKKGIWPEDVEVPVNDIIDVELNPLSSKCYYQYRSVEEINPHGTEKRLYLVSDEIRILNDDEVPIVASSKQTHTLKSHPNDPNSANIMLTTSWESKDETKKHNKLKVN